MCGWGRGAGCVLVLDHRVLAMELCGWGGGGGWLLELCGVMELCS